MCEGALVLLKLVREKDNSAQESLTLYFASVDLVISSEPPLQKQTHTSTYVLRMIHHLPQCYTCATLHKM